MISCSTHPGVICQVGPGEDTNFYPQIKTSPAFSNDDGGVLEVSPNLKIYCLLSEEEFK